jgi:hypothetical protein
VILHEAASRLGLSKMTVTRLKGWRAASQPNLRGGTVCYSRNGP